jgi:Lanthionine synthetase C-like protein/Protein kinase domain
LLRRQVDAGVVVLGIVSESLARLGERSARWRIEPDHATGKAWITVMHRPSRRPEQGWKLHVSAAVWTADSVLRRTLPVLLDEDADFKLAASAGRLAELNDGRGGLSQVGKFITVYPNDDAQAVRLAIALDEATRGLRGPAILSDRALRHRSLVHYRYGGFGGQQVRTPLGETMMAIRAPDGTLLPDRRTDVYSPPSWAPDPFIAAGVAGELPAPPRRIGGRYVIVATLHQSPRSTVYLGLDIGVPRRCVIKRVAEDGNRGFERLRWEAEILTRLAPDARFPTPLDLVDHGDDLFLIMEDVEGQTIEQRLFSLKERSTLPARHQIVGWGRDIAHMLEAIHAKGLVYGDLKPSNVVVTPSGRLRLLDFELARERDGAGQQVAQPSGLGTEGYMSPQQLAGHAPDPTDDVYALGALLYLLATGAEPSRAPRPRSLLDRPVELLNPAVGPALAAVVARCLDPDPARRFRSPADVAAALADPSTADPQGPFQPASAGEASTEEPDDQRWLQLARQVGDLVGAALQRALEQPPYGGADGDPSRTAWQHSTDLNIGGAGAVLGLAELVAELAEPSHRNALAEGARWLAGAPRAPGAPLPGLYVGEAGSSVALLRAGQVLGDPDLIDAATERGHWIATLPHTSPDLFNGTAGRLRLHLWLWQATTDAEQLGHAVTAAERLLALAELEQGTVRWTTPAGYGSLSGRALSGYAHGAAGIGDALLDLFQATDDARLLDAARGVGRWLEHLAQPALHDGSGCNWPIHERGSSSMAFWCHGAAGIARFLARLGAVSEMAAPIALAERAARVVAYGTRWAGATQCHGLAGNIECLLDLYQTGADEAYLREARSLGRILEVFAQELDTMAGDSPAANPGFTAGSAGVAACLLRLAHPETRPHLLTLRGLADRQGR